MDMKTVRIFCGFDLTQEDRDQISFIAEQVVPDLRILFNQSGRCDLAVVLNYDPRMHWVICPEGRLVKWLTEPVVSNVFSRKFSVRHSIKYSKVFTSFPTSKNATLSPPLYPPRISHTFLKAVYKEPLKLPRKTRSTSMVLSHLVDLPGHRLRHELLEAIRKKGLKIDAFGRGVNPVERKEDALEPYMFSIVVENTISGHYWSEKVTDAFLCGTVPVYVGASQLADYFPKGSFIDANGLSIDAICELLATLDHGEYSRRNEALKQARQACMFKYNLPNTIAEILDGEPHSSRFTFRGTADSNTLVHWILKVAAPGLRWAANLINRFATA